jgi:aminopeptidase YwaD
MQGKFVMKRTILLTILICISVTITSAQQHLDLLNPGIRDILLQGLDGEKAKQHVVELSKFHRVQGSPGYHQAAAYVLAQLKSFGFTDKTAYIESYKTDGDVSYQTWQSPPGWDIEAAELSIMGSTEEKLVSYQEVPVSLMPYSNPGDVTAEIVFVGQGTSDDDYKGKKVKGKFVLATGDGGEVHRLAVIKYGAKAVVCYPDNARSKEHPDMIHYTGLWPRKEELKKTTFGFNISNAHGEKIRTMLDSGTTVTMHGWVKGTGLTSSTMEVVVAYIPGKSNPAEELVFSAHLDHPTPSANDNASGSAAILDIARTLRQLIDQNKIKQPNRSLRFLWVPEWYGTMAYIDAHRELAGLAEKGKVLGNINLDMVGENPELLHSKMYIIQTPYSVPSCLNDVVVNMAEMVDKLNIISPNGSRSAFNFRVVPYSGGSDHMMFLDRKIPSVMLGHSDYTHHTTYDTPGNVDPTELKRSEMIAAGSLLYLANLSLPEGEDLMDLLKANSYSPFGELLRKMRSIAYAADVKDMPVVWGENNNRIIQLMTYYDTAAASILRFISSPNLKTQADQMNAHLGKRFEHLLAYAKTFGENKGYSGDAPTPLSPKLDNRIPIRLTRGPLDFRLPESKLPPKEAAWYASKEFSLTPDQRFELVNFIDGTRTVSQIRFIMIAEFSRIPDAVIAHYLEDLVKVGVVKWK